MSYQILSTLLMERDNKVKGRLYHNTQILLAYNSNRIEGTRLSEEQTRSIFETKSFIADKEEIIFPDDIIETKNHFKAFDYLLDVADATLSEEIIKRFHFIISILSIKSRIPNYYFFHTYHFMSLPYLEYLHLS